ncbi:MAG: CBS domain-containing protein [Geobacter sp.]|nr:CBS domain-containing protein [Geobacter sp.]
MTEELNEVYFSRVLKKMVINEHGKKIGMLSDLVMIPGEGFPQVSNLIVRQDKRTISIPWSSISLFNRFVVSVRGSATYFDAYTEVENEIHVKRDILDKQIVDVDGAKVVRVNDIKLGKYKEFLCILSVDIGLAGLLRRLGFETFGKKVASLLNKEIPRQEISWEYVQPLEMNLSRLALTMAQDQLAEMHPADLASIISNISHQHIQTVLISLDTETAGEALHELDPELRSRIITEMDSELASDILEEMEPDEAADVLGDLSEEKAQELLGLMDAEEAEDIQELMEHEDDTAGGLMNNSFLTVHLGQTVGEAFTAVQANAAEVEMVAYTYVLDEQERLAGVVSLRDLLITSPETTLDEIMSDNVKSVSVTDEPEDVLEIIAKYNLLSVPVLDDAGGMLGIITVDDILEMFLPYALKRKRHG